MPLPQNNDDDDELPLSFWIALMFVLIILLLLGAGVQGVLEMIETDDDRQSMLGFYTVAKLTVPIESMLNQN